MHETIKDGHAQCTGKASAEQVQYVEPQEEQTSHFSLAIISVTVQLLK
jgi:hypothetical protein